MEVLYIKKIRYLLMNGDCLSTLLLYIMKTEIKPSMIQRNKSKVFNIGYVDESIN